MAPLSSLAFNRQKLIQIGAFAAIAVLAFVMGTPNLYRSMISTHNRLPVAQQLAGYLTTEASTKQALGSPGVVRRLSENADKSEGVLDRIVDTGKVIRTGALTMVVLHPAEVIEHITQVAQAHGGYVVRSQVSGERERETGTVTIRVPANQFEPVRKELKGLAKSVEQESTTADDATLRAAENEATLRNYRAEETSYIEIMKRSGKISDTLEVARELADVRGRIERLAAEIRTMNLQVEMTAITVNLRTEPIAVSRNIWRPFYELKLACNDGLDALSDYATAMMAFVLRLPAVIAWALTFLIGLKLGLKLLKRIAQSFGLLKQASVTQ